MTLVRRNENVFPDFWNNFFENEWFPTHQSRKTESRPAVNIKETDKLYQLDMALPGVKKEHIQIDVENDSITISAESSENSETKKEGKVTRREFNYSSFKRTFTLPEDTVQENISAKYTDGILSVEFPKADLKKEEPVKKIAIQ